jgi:hypothetical protein
MNLDNLENKLLNAARLVTPSDAVPYAFEKRIMARLSGRATGDLGAASIRALWRAAACSAAIAVVISVWMLLPSSGQRGSGDLSQDFETTVYAMVDEVNDSW